MSRECLERSSRLRWLVVGFAVLLLSACSSMPVAPSRVANPAQSWQQHQQQLQALQHWQLSGEVGVVVKQQGQAANIAWTQAGSQLTIELYGPLGLGTDTITGAPGHVVLVTHDHKRFVASDGQQLMQEVLGWSLPVSGLTFWVVGLPVPGQPADDQLNEYGTLASLQQEGWNIQYLQYAVIDGYILPTRMRLQQGDVRVVMAVSQWRVK